jgi:uncharacterized membrane protein
MLPLYWGHGKIGQKSRVLTWHETGVRPQDERAAGRSRPHSRPMPTTPPRRPNVGGHARDRVGAEQTHDPTLARIGAFSDGVFAFAMTLLILTIRIPHPTDADASQGLLALLTEQWRSYLAVVLSFMLVGINWANHRVMLTNFARATHTLIWLNLLYLLVSVAFMPVPTAVLGAWLGDPHNEVVAAVFYGAAVTVGAVVYNVLWWYGAYVAKLTLPTISPIEVHAHTLAWAPSIVVLAALTLVAFANPLAAVVGYVAVVFVYVLPIPSLLALSKRRHHAQSLQRE